MASISISYSHTPRGFIRVENDFTHEACDYSLYASSAVPSGIIMASGDPVIENAQCSFYVLLPADTPVAELSVSVNGSDHMAASVDSRVMETVEGELYSAYRVLMKPNEKRPFLLTFGFARIEVSIALPDSPESEIVLTTKDIPCLSSDDYQASSISQMLAELLDTEEDTVAKWMFFGGEDSRAAYSIVDGALRDESPKSLSSMVQLFESALIEYESNYIFFQSHGFSKIVRANSKLPPRKIRRTESHELLWVAKNSHVLAETPYETSINYLGKYYIPREVETGIRVKSYDSYENRLVLGFLGELLATAKVIFASLKSDVVTIRELEERLNPLARKEYSLPALTLLRQCATRENYFIAKLQIVVESLQRLKRRYEAALPGVKAQFSRIPRRTKVFQEIKCYSGIYGLILKWLRFGDFALARENLALHSLRLDKLYEYYALFRLLCWLHDAGFEEDHDEELPIEQASFSLVSGYYRNEKQVATLYKLVRGDVRIRLYYQPVIYGDEREENGVTLHRLSCRNPKSSVRRDSYWTPDFMLMVRDGRGNREWHIFDAKFSKASNLWDGYPKSGTFTEVISKYKTDVSGSSPYDRVSSVWLLSGRDQGRCFQHAELSSWALGRYAGPHSGIGALTPSYSCLDEIFPSILGLGERTPEDSDEVSPASSVDAGALPFMMSSGVQTSAAPAASASIRSSREGSANRCLPLIVELHSIVEDSGLLYKSRWSEANLGIAHPLLRKSAPRGREGKYYAKAEVNGEACYVYRNWLPNYESRLRAYLESRRRST